MNDDSTGRLDSDKLVTKERIGFDVRVIRSTEESDLKGRRVGAVGASYVELSVGVQEDVLDAEFDRSTGVSDHQPTYSLRTSFVR